MGSYESHRTISGEDEEGAQSRCASCVCKLLTLLGTKYNSRPYEPRDKAKCRANEDPPGISEATRPYLEPAIKIVTNVTLITLTNENV